MSAKRIDFAIRIAGTLFVFLLGIFIGASVYERETGLPQALENNRSAEQTQAPEALTKTDDSPLLVAASEKTCWVDRYTVCGHEYIYNEDVSKLSRERLMALYPEVFAIDAATGESVMLERDVEGFCAHHVLLRLSDGKLCLYSMDGDTHELRELAGIELEIASLPYQTLSELAEGVLFDDMAQVDAYLESLDS